MNLGQRLAALLPTARVYETLPETLPNGPYVVVSELTDGARTEYYAAPDGHISQDRTLTVLLTLYGPQASSGLPPLSGHRALHGALLRVHEGVTAHPGLPLVRGCQRAAVLPPQVDKVLRRAWSGVRVLITYTD